MKYDVFISHSSKDKEFVRKLAKDLQRNGIEVWLDEWTLKIGDSFAESILVNNKIVDTKKMILTK
ncbi:MAG: toll/interleukin-1 receptor domain-containing protein [Bacteroidales bacterium]|nr:toll/interleukin-1 receptor domain-containing protein [Bacteroidales bacterium]